MYIAGDACAPLRINDATALEENDAAAEASSVAGDAGVDAPDASIDPATACLTDDDIFVLGGDDGIHQGPPLVIEGGTGWSVQVGDDSSTGRPDLVEITVESLTWTVIFSTANTGAPLAVANYAGAERDPFEDPGRPGLSVFGNGVGCNTVAGSFQVLSLDYGPPGDASADAGADAADANTTSVLRSFTASFVQHCDEGTTYNFGCVHITM
jgi:hypothetical protein